MKNPIENLNKIFDSRIRLGIMSALMVNDEINFNDLKEILYALTSNIGKGLKDTIVNLQDNGSGHIFNCREN